MPDQPSQDPLGLDALARLVDDLVERPWAKQPGSPSIDMQRLGEVVSEVLDNYSMLRDRYILLKASNKSLSEEIAWLRDQCDDYAARVQGVDRADERDRPAGGKARAIES